MIKINKDASAFPIPGNSHPDFQGLSIRAYYAGLAMQSLFSRGLSDSESVSENCYLSVAIADKLIEALNHE
jgi:hypothetical protein